MDKERLEEIQTLLSAGHFHLASSGPKVIASELYYAFVELQTENSELNKAITEALEDNSNHEDNVVILRAGVKRLTEALQDIDRFVAGCVMGQAPGRNVRNEETIWEKTKAALRKDSQ